MMEASNLGTWTEADFVNSIRNRKSEWMPFESLAKFSDDELKALRLFLEALPALETTVE